MFFGLTCFDDIKTVHRNIHLTFRDACFAMGLLDDNKEFIDGLKEAATWATGISLRQLFVSMLLSGALNRSHFVWESTKLILSEDMFYVPQSESSRSGSHVA